jgi:molybdopterin adenylyltransferase
MEDLVIHSLNISERKGIIKRPVNSVVLDEYGIVGDAHAGNWGRQVSMLGFESIAKFSELMERQIAPGEFAENLTLKGVDMDGVNLFDRFTSGDIELEVTQIGKKCHNSNCPIFNKVGDCIMPREGVFFRVISGGTLDVGATMKHLSRVFKIQIVTLSDRATAGIYKDKSGPLLNKLILNHFKSINRKAEIDVAVIPDEGAKLAQILLGAVNSGADVIFTTGGTGIGERDITPDVIKPMLDKEIPGIMEMIRVKYGVQNPNALLSRGVAGVMGKTLVYTLPGNPKAVTEYTEEIFKTLEHAFHMLHKIDVH